MMIKNIFPTLVAVLLVLFLSEPARGQTPAVQLPATGQTTSYGSNDDGDLQKGVAAPSPRFSDSGHGTVTDSLTGLIWLKKGSCAGIDAAVSWETAMSYVNELNSSGTMNSQPCGDISNGGSHQTDWRLPNVLEMESLINLEEPNTVTWLNTQPFDQVATERYWTSTSYTDADPNPEYDNHAWHAHFQESRIRHDAKSTEHAVWAVRGGE